MSGFFKWLATNSFAGYAFASVIVIVTMLLVVSYVTALIQGRSISYWPPNIGERAADKSPARIGTEDQRSVSPAAAASSTTHTDVIDVTWTSPAPEAEQLLRYAKYSALIIGTSLFRIVHSDLFVYRDWLQRQPERLLGLLFLSPFSPHATGRERRDVHRSSAKNILDSIRVAYVEAGKHPQIVPAIYDGPFRYTARAVDVGREFESNASTISIVTSSHTQGISKGFNIVVPKSRENPPYEYYRDELSDIWMQALANPPGHGVSIVGHAPELADQEQVKSITNGIIDRLSSRNRLAHLFSPDQLHITLTSLCRTQAASFYGPLRIGRAVSPEHLPRHFGEFLCELTEKSHILFTAQMSFRFSRVSLDRRGYINLEPDDGDHSQLLDSLNAFLSRIRDQVSQYAHRYPSENWSAVLNNDKEQRFGPKSPPFIPHVTLGMAFSQQRALPLPLTDAGFSLDLRDAFVCTVEGVSIVHYAYRSHLRNVGSFRIQPQRPENQNECRILQALGIEIEFPALGSNGQR
jgi:hypothetical protein